jgi:hypothetical protein
MALLIVNDVLEQDIPGVSILMKSSSGTEHRVDCPLPNRHVLTRSLLMSDLPHAVPLCSVHIETGVDFTGLLTL